MPGSTIVAVTGKDERKRVLARAEALARERGASVILFDRDADFGPFESPLPTEWSADGEEEQFGDRLTPADLEAAGQAALARQVDRLRAAGIQAFGWLPTKGNARSLAEYVAAQRAEAVVVSAADKDVADELPAGSAVVEVVPDA
jgi:hypothetical protein